MSAAVRLWVLMAATALGGCVASTIEGADQHLPTISYDLNGRGDFAGAEQRAQQWCKDNFGRRARLVNESDYDDADERVTFECFVE